MVSVDIISRIGTYSDESIVDVVQKIEKLLDEQIDRVDSELVRDYVSRLSAFRGRLIAIESQLYRDLVLKKEDAIENDIMSEKTKEKREIQLDAYVKIQKSNYDLIKKYREELTSKTTLCSSVLKSVDLNYHRGNSSGS